MPVTDYSAGGVSPATEREITHDAAGSRDYRAGGQAFLWIAWAAAFAFWAFTFSSAIGIFGDVLQPAEGPTMAGPQSAALVLIVGAFLLLVVALAWGCFRSARGDRSEDPVTEASTRALYNAVERAGGDDMVTRSPGARKPHQRDSYRPA